MKTMLETLLKGLVFQLAINVCKNPVHTPYCVSQDLNHVGKLLALSVGSVFYHSCSPTHVPTHLLHEIRFLF
jgi:hypothetical protein